MWGEPVAPFLDQAAHLRTRTCFLCRWVGRGRGLQVGPGQVGPLASSLICCGILSKSLNLSGPWLPGVCNGTLGSQCESTWRSGACNTDANCLTSKNVFAGCVGIPATTSWQCLAGAPLPQLAEMAPLAETPPEGGPWLRLDSRSDVCTRGHSPPSCGLEVKNPLAV